MRIYLFILFFIGIIQYPNSQCLAQINLAQGLQLYLPFSGNALDASGNGNNATVNGATLTTDAFGNANSAYLFNGISDFMEVVSTANLQCKDSISLCAKVFVTGFYAGICQSNIILQKKNDDFGNGHYSMRFGDSPYDADCNLFNPTYETFYGHMNSLGNFPVGTGAGQAGAPPYILQNQWYCVIYTWDGDTVRMYVDGIKRFQFSNPNASNGITSENLFIGKRNDVNYPFYFKGKLDEIRIYNRALKPQEVSAYCNVCQNIQNTTNIITTSDTSICKGKSATILASTSLPISYAYTWYPTATITNNNVPNALATPINNTTYFLKITDTNGCFKTDSIQISLYTASPINAGIDTGLCIGGSVTLNAIGLGNFAWQPNIGLSNNSIANPVCTVNVATNYTVSLTDGNGCVTADTIAVGILANPIIQIPAQYFYCLGAPPIQLTTGGSGTFSWNPATGLSANNVNNPFANPNITTIYTITLSNSNNCSTSSIVTINVNPSPIITTSLNDSICIGDSSLLLVSGANDYFWKPSTSLNNGIIFNPTATPNVTTIYTVTASNSANCTTTATILIAVSPAINLQIVSTPDSTFCLGDSVQLIAYGATKYVWTPTFNTNIISNNSVTIWPINSTTYTVLATNDFNCTTIGTYNVVVQNPPIVTASKSGDVSCEKKTVSLFAIGASNFVWANANTLSANSGSMVLATPVANTTYTVTGIEGKCKVDALIEVFIQDQENKRIFIPNGLTMNGDGLNDGLQIRSNVNFTKFNFIIYNRFGQQVFASDNINKVWYGEQNGNYSKRLDTYFYYLRAQDECGEIIRKGDITVIR
jgi:gliding motility-associated-like protein